MLLACLLARAASGAVRGVCSPASGRGHCKQLAAVTAAVFGLPARTLVHQHPCVQPPSETAALQLLPSGLRPPHSCPSPVPRAPARAGRCCLPCAWSGRVPAAHPPPSCEGGTGLAALPSVSGGRSIWWGILAEMEVFSFFSLSQNAGNPSPAADTSHVCWLLPLL